MNRQISLFDAYNEELFTKNNFDNLTIFYVLKSRKFFLMTIRIIVTVLVY